ncbi:uncharacterized protein LOC123554581 [Mercenaria mercenaria]|uniref:uncharacterized protein LOC123554581 n=1 Tax=Mercenaria mercenaria TaxID=6596 RepID=UPI00234F3E4B|nr:uncharacterized protein LOC123554581 [Mercenaria mercenaria]
MCSKSKTQEYDLHKIAIGASIVLFTLLLSLNLLVFKFQSEEALFRNTGYFINLSEEYSVFCEDLSLSPYEDSDTFNEKKNKFKYSLYNDKYVCRNTNLTLLVEKIVERESRLRLSNGLGKQPYLQCGNDTLREPSGYLSATFLQVSHHHTFRGQGKDSVILWDKHPRNSFISKDFHYPKGELRIPEARFYFLYASVLINVRCLESRPGQFCRIYLRLCAKSRGYERILLQKLVVHNTAGNNSVSTLHVASHIFLARDDTVFVRVSEATRVISTSAGNVFGIIPLR